MAKKLSFDKLPEAVEKILELLTAEESEHQALPELVLRVKRLEMQFDSIERILSPNRRTMDRQTVFKVLKLRPKQVSELEQAGLLLSHSEGRRTYYYEDDVVRCFMNQSQWKSALEEAAKAPVAKDVPATATIEPESATETGLLDLDAAAAYIGKSRLTLYKLSSQKKIPTEKQGRKLFFRGEVLQEYLDKSNAPKPQPKANRDRVDEKVTIDGKEYVDINAASEILGRTPGAIRQHLATLPHEKVGNRLYFDPGKLSEWAQNRRPYNRKPNNNETEPA